MYEKAVVSIKDMAEKNKGKILAGLTTDEFTQAIGFMVETDPKDIQKMIPELEKNGVININGDKIYIQ